MIRELADWVSGENLLPVSQTAIFSPCPHRTEEARELSGVPFIRTLIPLIT